MASLRKVLRRLDGWEWLTFAIAVWAVVGPATLYVAWFTTQSSSLQWIWVVAELPVLFYALASLWFVGISSSPRLIIGRDTLLWSWLTFLGSAFRGGALLLVGAIVGTTTALFVGDGQNLHLLASTASLVVYAFGGWLVLAIVVWTGRALIDVMGRRQELEENLLEWMLKKEIKHPKQIAKFLEEGASPYFVIVSALGLLLAVLAATFWAGSALKG